MVPKQLSVPLQSADTAEVRIFCEYNDRYGSGPSISFSFLSANNDAETTAKLQQVKSIGAIEAVWDKKSDVPQTFFVDGFWDGTDYVKGFVDATGLPPDLFEHLSQRYEDGVFDPLRFYLKDVEASTLMDHLEKCATARADTKKMADVLEAEALVVKNDGQILPLWEKVGDDGKIEVFSVALPAVGTELVQALYLDRLDDENSAAAKP